MIANLGRTEKITIGGAAPSGPATRVVVPALEAGSNVEFVVALAELVDLGEEKARLKKEVESLAKFVGIQEGKLANESFVSRAPVEVIDKEKLKLTEAKDKLAKVQATLAALGG